MTRPASVRARRRTRGARLVGACAVLAATSAPWTLAAHAAGGCTGVTAAGGGWVALAPRFPAGDAAVRFYSAPAFEPDLLYAANSEVLMRSTDAGCTWTKVYEASTDLPGGTAEITALLGPSSSTNSDYVYVGVTARLAAGLTSPQVAVSAKRGAAGSWSVNSPDPGTGAGAIGLLPPLGTVTQLAANPALPANAYAVIENNAGAVDRAAVWGTGDAGKSWAMRTGATNSYTGTGLLAHPSRQVDVFARVGTRVEHSTDGGSTFSSASPSDAVTAFAGAGGAGGIKLVASLASGPTYAVSTDNGASWNNRPALGNIDDITVQALGGAVAYATGSAVVLDMGGAVPPTLVGPPGQAPNRLALSAPTAEGFTLSGLREGKILQVALRSVGGGPTGPIEPPVDRDGNITPVRIHGTGTHQFPSLLRPAELRVALPAGGTLDVPYDLLIPRTPTPVDAMFLVDTTGSMGGTINGLRKDLAAIVTAMDAAGLDARFGLGDFQDYPYGSGNTDHAYQLDRRIGPADAGMKKALDDLTLGGGGDGPEAVLTALLQSTTGQGDFSVPAGQQAHYRPYALKLAFTATDNPFHKRGDDWEFDSNGNNIPWPGPDWDETITALNRAHVHQVGLAVDSGAYGDMARAALDTDTKAPAGGIDCNGDGIAEVKADDPMVCDISQLVSSPVGVETGGDLPSTDTATSAAGITAAVVSLANGIPDFQRTQLRLTQGQRYARIVAGQTSAVLNLRADNSLGYTLRLHCPIAAPSQQRVAMQASTSLRALADAHVTLQCGGPGVKTPAIPGLDPVAAVAAAPVTAPAPAQPVPNPNPQPNPNPNSNPQTNANVNPNSGFVEQSQEEAQLALAAGDMEGLPRESGELAMSARRDTDAELGFVAAAGLLLSAAFGVAVRNRSRATTCSV